jgi:molybdenum cofactor biosynthesis enzyme MoaA
VVENNFTKSFTFNANNTGTEVQAADDVRSFTWSIKDGKPTVVYVNELTEWQFTLSCESNRLTVFGLVYTKL